MMATQENHNNPSDLIESMRMEADDTIRKIKDDTAAEIKQIQSEYRSELMDFEKRIKSETEKNLDLELSILDNRETIETGKLRLSVLESFLEQMIQEAVSDFKNAREDYKHYLIITLKNILDLTGTEGVTVKLSAHDSDCRQKILETGVTDVVTDMEVILGGIIVEDHKELLNYNSTIQRMIYRKRDRIRKEMFGILSNHNLI